MYHWGPNSWQTGRWERRKEGGKKPGENLKKKKIILDEMLTTQKPLKERTSAWWKCHKQNLQTSWGNRIHSKALHYIFHKELLKIHRHISTQTQIPRNLVENRQIHHKSCWAQMLSRTRTCAVTCGHGSKWGKSLNAHQQDELCKLWCLYTAC